MPRAGDIVFVRFPFGDKKADMLHPALVLDDQGGQRYELAYGSSKHVDTSCPRGCEVVVSSAQSLAACGLNRPTRFDLSIRASMFIDARRSVAGALPPTEIGQLFRAAKHCKLI